MAFLSHIARCGQRVNRKFGRSAEYEAAEFGEKRGIARKRQFTLTYEYLIRPVFGAPMSVLFLSFETTSESHWCECAGEILDPGSRCSKAWITLVITSQL